MYVYIIFFKSFSPFILFRRIDRRNFLLHARRWNSRANAAYACTAVQRDTSHRTYKLRRTTDISPFPPDFYLVG